MKILFALNVILLGLVMGGCGMDQPLVSDEEWNASHKPAAHSPDAAAAHIPQPSDRPYGY